MNRDKQNYGLRVDYTQIFMKRQKIKYRSYFLTLY